jgi:uncharacterized protein YeeX (DUF496 family)
MNGMTERDIYSGVDKSPEAREMYAMMVAEHNGKVDEYGIYSADISTDMRGA